MTEGELGVPALIYFEDLDSPEHREARDGLGSQWTIGPDEGSRSYRLLVSHGPGGIDELWIVDSSEGPGADPRVHLSGAAAERLVGLIRGAAFQPPTEGALPPPPRLLPDAQALAAAYAHDPDVVRSLIASDVRADDVVAWAHRREVVEEFARMLDDDAHFDSLLPGASGSTERVWQQFFEKNPWLLGLNLSAQLLVGWDPDRLERTVVGSSVATDGKRADAVLRTAGAIRMLAFAEIKHHRTDLLGEEYRSGCWAPSAELVGATSQAQGTVRLAMEAIGSRLAEVDNGFEVVGGQSYLYRPRSYVVAGRLSEFASPEGGHHVGKIRSFELYRRNLLDPEIVTFDELLARARALVEVGGG